jgi:Protein tyrosine and serine/threonine kinase
MYAQDQWKSLRADELQGWSGQVLALAVYDPQAHETPSGWDTGHIIGVALGVLVLVVIILLVVAWAVRKLGRRRSHTRWQYLEIPDDTGKPLVSLAGILNDPQIPKVHWEKLEFLDRVGVGSSGEVHRGLVDGKREVAIKTLLLGDAMLEDEPFIQEFLVEIKISHALKHNNILNFVGVSIRPGSMELALLAEYMERGSLAQLLDRKRRSMPLKLKMSIALDIACGMCYLHNWKPPLIHRDLKPGNCLLNRDWVCKIADMGVSTFKRRAENTMTQVGCPLYMTACGLLVYVRCVVYLCMWIWFSYSPFSVSPPSLTQCLSSVCVCVCVCVFRVSRCLVHSGGSACTLCGRFACISCGRLRALPPCGHISS